MSTEPIQPAFTPEEWARLLPPRADGTMPRPTLDIDEGVVAITVRGDEASWPYPCTIYGEDNGDATPHQIAAACLYGQPFGFTHEEVDALRQLSVARAMPWEPGELERLCALQQSVAAKIAALLPLAP